MVSGFSPYYLITRTQRGEARLCRARGGDGKRDLGCCVSD
jgi:hypothetical protein